MLPLIGAILFVVAAIAIETAAYFWEVLPALNRMGLVHGAATFCGLMALIFLVELIWK